MYKVKFVFTSKETQAGSEYRKKTKRVKDKSSSNRRKKTEKMRNTEIVTKNFLNYNIKNAVLFNKTLFFLKDYEGLARQKLITIIIVYCSRKD